MSHMTLSYSSQDHGLKYQKKSNPAQIQGNFVILRVNMY